MGIKEAAASFQFGILLCKKAKGLEHTPDPFSFLLENCCR
jgi:hypothetical protein